jgi:hypothetical protein
VAVSSSQINLTWSDNSNNEDGFEIERSLDGVTFSTIATTAANVTDYSDTGLAAETTYDYRVLAFNANGNNGYSNIFSETTKPDGQGTSLQVGSVSLSTINLGRGLKRGRADVVVVDDFGTPISGAVVTGDFTGDLNESGATGNATTDGNGSTTIFTTESAKPLNTLTFCVTSITHPDLLDFSGSICGSL